MSHLDNKDSSAAKQARTDGSRRKDDWTCPSCGNVNFSFRTTCNMRNCTRPRPVDHNAKSAATPMQTPLIYSSSAPNVGSGAPSSMYMGLPPYGSSFFIGLRPVFFPDDKSTKMSADATRDNDWTCLKCGNNKFSFRTVCNMRKCRTPKPGSQSQRCPKESPSPATDGNEQ